MSSARDSAKDSLLQAHWQTADDDLALHEMTVGEKELRLQPAKRRRCSLSPTNPLFWLVMFLTGIAAFGWLGVFMCIDGACSPAAMRQESLPGSSVVPNCQRPPWYVFDVDADRRIVPMSKRIKFEYNSSFTAGDETEVQEAWDELLAREYPDYRNGCAC